MDLAKYEKVKAEREGKRLERRRQQEEELRIEQERLEK